jgi:predicted small lipoprotein YifL
MTLRSNRAARGGRLALLLLLAALALAPAACGKKGDPTLPAGTPDDGYPHRYPSINSQ